MNKYDRYNATEKGRARRRRHEAKRRAILNARRVFGASGYLGVAPSAEQAQGLNLLGREFRARQNQTRA